MLVHSIVSFCRTAFNRSGGAGGALPAHHLDGIVPSEAVEPVHCTLTMVYKEAPWTFTGRAIYQLQLVKAEEAKKHIPQEFKLVEAFGYTLGGFYLARYEDSPVGSFEECVVMAGLVWNPPTSCAWAARVFVSNKEARDHGLQHVGLPSRLAGFEAAAPSNQTTTSSSSRSSTTGRPVAAAGTVTLSSSSSEPAACTWWFPKGKPSSPSDNDASSSSSSRGLADVVHMFNLDKGRRGFSTTTPVVTFQLPSSIPVSGFLGPRMRLALPSFSGGTSECPGLLQYSCDLQTNVMPVTPLQVVLPGTTQQSSSNESSNSSSGKDTSSSGSSGVSSSHPELLNTLLSGKPLVALAFSDMKMLVQEPSHLTIPAQQQEQQLVPATQALADLAAGSSSRRR